MTSRSSNTHSSSPAKAGEPVRRGLSIPSLTSRNTGSPAFAGDDSRNYSRGIICPRFRNQPCPLEFRGRREDRVNASPAVSCAKQCNKHAHEHTGLAETHGLPCAMALRLIRFRPGDRLSCHHRSRAALAAFELDASTGASDPNDFAVRNAALVSRDPTSIASLPRVCDDGRRPSGGTGWRQLWI